MMPAAVEMKPYWMPPPTDEMQSATRYCVYALRGAALEKGTLVSTHHSFRAAVRAGRESGFSDWSVFKVSIQPETLMPTEPQKAAGP